MVLLLAAVAAVILANSSAGSALLAVKGTELAVPGLVHALSVGEVISSGLLAVFFFLVAIELRHELTHGELRSPHALTVPLLAALGGVVVPAVIYLVVVHDSELLGGWPIPTATDVAFALGVLALLGRGLPRRVRALLLALAIIDDLMAIILIAVVFTKHIDLLPLLGAVPVVALFGILSRLRPNRLPLRLAVRMMMVAVAVAAWVFVENSGVHATIAAVALGLVMRAAPAARAQHVLDPVSNLVVLPLFAFSAALVVIPTAGLTALGPVFWGIAIALPLGKLVGITLGGLLGSRLQPRSVSHTAPPLRELVVVAALGGIGFTVSLLMNQLAFSSPNEITQGTLGVLAGSMVAIVLGGTVTALVARRAHLRSER